MWVRRCSLRDVQQHVSVLQGEGSLARYLSSQHSFLAQAPQKCHPSVHYVMRTSQYVIISLGRNAARYGINT